MTDFKSNGKILLTSEYVVLDGVDCIALPTKFGQTLSVIENNSKCINWTSYDYNNNIWFKDKYTISSENKIEYSSEKNNISETLLKILNALVKLNSDKINNKIGYDFVSKLSFSKDWGLGTSSTLINNLANWAKVDSYELLKLTFGGSGYDIACAGAENPILFNNYNNKINILNSKFDPIYKENIFFIYLGNKQNSRDGIKDYKSKKNKLTQDIIEQFNSINKKIVITNNLKELNNA